MIARPVYNRREMPRSLAVALCSLVACTTPAPIKSGGPLVIGRGPSATTVPVIDAPRRPPDRVSYFVGGDSRGDVAGVVKWAFAQAKQAGAAGFIFLGDMEWSWGCDDHFHQEALDYLAPVPLLPVIGNHEVQLFGFLKGRVHAGVDPQRVFQKTFLGERGGIGAPASHYPDRVAYAVDLPKGLHLVVLDNATTGTFGDQLDWLDDDLSKHHDAKHKVVAMHKPLAGGCVGGHSMEESGDAGWNDSKRALAIFKKRGVELILASHVHLFAAYQQEGIPTYVSGGLGAHLVDCQCGDCLKFHHMLELDVSDEDIQVSAIRFPGRGGEDGGDDEHNAFPDLRCAGVPVPARVTLRR